MLVKERKIINSTYPTPPYRPKCKLTTLKEQTLVEVEEPKRDDGLSITDKDVVESEIPGLANFRQLNMNAYEGSKKKFIPNKIMVKIVLKRLVKK